MAQFWLTYQELADVFGGTAEQARTGSIENGWSRLKDRNGVTHVKLPAHLTGRYVERLRSFSDESRTVEGSESRPPMPRPTPHPALVKHRPDGHHDALAGA